GFGGSCKDRIAGKLQDELRGDVANAERAECKPYRDDAECAICWLRPRRSVWLCKEDAADLAVVELCDGVECGAWCNLGHVPKSSQWRVGHPKPRKIVAVHVRFRTDNLRPPPGTKGLADRFCNWRLVAIPHTCGREPGGKRRCQSPSAAAPFHDL